MANKNRPQLGLSATIWLYFTCLFLLVLVSVLLVLNYGFFLSQTEGYQERLLKSSLEKISDIADLKKETLAYWVEERRSDMKLLSAAMSPPTLWARQAGKKAAGAEDRSLTELQSWLKMFQLAHLDYTEVLILSVDEGRILVSSNPANTGQSILDHWPIPADWMYREEVVFNLPAVDARPYHFLWGRPLAPVGGKANRWVFIQINPQIILRNLLQLRLALGQSGEVLLVDSNQFILKPLKFPPSNASVPQPLAYHMKALPDHYAAQGFEGLVQAPDYRQVEVVAAFRHMQLTQRTGWGLVVKMDRDEISAPIIQATWFSLFLGLLGILVFGLVSRFLAAAITRPIEQLRQVAVTVMRGEPHRRALVRGSREISELGRSINEMVEQLEGSQTDLNEQVVKRTFELQRSNRMLEEMEETGKIGAWELDLNTFELTTTKGVLRIHESLNSLSFETAWDAYSEESKNLLHTAMNLLKEQGTPFDLELEMFPPSGNRRVINLVGAVTQGFGSKSTASGLIQDITERAQTLALLEQQRNRTQQYLSLAEVIIMVLDREWRVTLINSKGCELLGYAEEDILGNLWLDYCVDNDGSVQLHMVLDQLKAGEPGLIRQYNQAVQTQSGEVLDVWWHSSVEVDPEGEFAGIISSGLDITGIKSQEKKLRRLKTAIDTLSDAVFIIGGTGKVALHNPAYLEISTLFSENFFSPDDQGGLYLDQNILAELTQTGHWKGELISRKDPSQPVYINTTVTRIPVVEMPNAASYAVIAIDVTEDKLRQVQLIQVQKMESLGVLAGGVAHEINNPVGFVASNLATLQEYLVKINALEQAYEQVIDSLDPTGGTDGPKAIIQEKKKALDYELIKQDLPVLVADMDDGIRRIKEIVVNLREVCHRDNVEISMADINHILAQTVKVAWNELKYKCKVIEEFGDIPKVPCYQQAIQQVFLNFLINAAQAIETQGTILLRTQVEGERLKIDIEDDGPGIEPKNLERIFEPFFTTKEIGQGTGLGLSISFQIIQEHQGEITVRSRLGEGTQFSIFLPLKPPPSTT